ncbi:unnamed protein product [Paramecium primaurelia]|uniref:SET domain-containing protein n=1 Tax=Paramecium primaurelia TaxID=5886 RepID=A0A8S1NXW0_PARPR|nr:unnamed protein product [Paramecium primaurelia]
MKEQSITLPITMSDMKESSKPKLLEFKKNTVCAKCKIWIIKQKYANCVICEDAYHFNCMRPKQIQKDWTCAHCIELKNTFPDTNDVETDNICQKCQKEVDTKDEEICSKCNKIFHKKCYGQKTISPICNFCHSQKPSKINFNEKMNQLLNFSVPMTNSNLFILPCCVYNDKLRQNCFQSLQYALYCQNINFNDDLVYSSIKKELNNGYNEKLDPLIGKDLITFKKYKQVTKNGFYGPLIVEYNSDQGFYVRSVQPIAYKTLICEYAGDVYRFADQVYSTSDSIMSLLETGFAATSLVIIPEKNGNIAKYLSGINNSKKNSKKIQQNVKSRRYNVEGQSRVILYACRDIKSGEILYYDYNEGGFKYNTNYFV